MSSFHRNVGLLLLSCACAKNEPARTLAEEAAVEPSPQIGGSSGSMNARVSHADHAEEGVLAVYPMGEPCSAETELLTLSSSLVAVAARLSEGSATLDYLEISPSLDYAATDLPGWRLSALENDRGFSLEKGDVVFLVEVSGSPVFYRDYGCVLESEVDRCFPALERGRYGHMRCDFGELENVPLHLYLDEP